MQLSQQIVKNDKMNEANVCINHINMIDAVQIKASQIQIRLTTLKNIDKKSVLKQLYVKNQNNDKIKISDVTIVNEKNKLYLSGNFSCYEKLFVIFNGKEHFVRKSWQYTDTLYAYDGKLGARVFDNGKRVEMTIWSPSASRVQVVLYDKDNQHEIVGTVDMARGDKGEWHATLTSDNELGIVDYRGYYYHYAIERDGKSVLVLDPYAKSLAAWNSDTVADSPAHKVAKAAIVDVAAIGNKERQFANIPGFTKREDAIIYEVHVRDFTSDEAIAPALTQQFGTFVAFGEKLDYLQQLGVTHIQLLPVMSCYYVNELANATRLSDYTSSGSNYNWGYDPQSYFALTGMYATNPSDSAKRIEEFKQLVDAIHERGMGVILDVVYNHTAKLDIFENLEPNYYHFMDEQGVAKTSFGGGRLGTTHHMARRVLVDSIVYLVDEYKVDGFRFDMMGDHDAASIQAAYESAKALNPNIIMLGEGWVTYVGDDNLLEQPADQTWMSQTDSVASFSDDMRNMLKSGYPNEGTPAFITGGARPIWSLFNNIKAQPNNFLADDPGDVIQYISAHDNLTLFDIIAQSIKKDPSVPENNREIHKRLRLGNTLVLTAQGTPFIHAGQEYGRTKQFLADSHRTLVSEENVPNKSHVLRNSDGTPFDYPYFIHDSYDSSDAINRFDWTKATDEQTYPEHTRSRAFTAGLIALRRSSDAFRWRTRDEVDRHVTLISVPHHHGIGENDLVVAYQATASNGDRYAVFINADTQTRHVAFGEVYAHLKASDVLVDGAQAGIRPIAQDALVGVYLTETGVTLDPLTATVLRVKMSEKDDEMYQ